MNFVRLFFLIFFLHLTSVHIESQSLILPQEVGNKRSQDIGLTNITFYEYPYISDEIDLRDFKKKYPNLVAADQVQIQTSSISSVYSLTVLIGVEGKEDLVEEDLVIWLAADYHSNDVLFFLNKNQNRNFSTNPDFLRLKSTDDVQTVVLKKETPGSNELRLRLKVPKNRNTKTLKKNRISKRILNQFALGVHIAVGTGELTYSYDNIELGFPTWYDINFTEKGLGLELSYNLPLFRFAVLTNYNNSFSYTSYLNIRYDEPEEFISPITGRTMINENVEVLQNKDLHSNNKLDYGAVLGLRLHLKSIEIQPFVTVGQSMYFPGEYAGNRHDEDEIYNLSPSWFYEGGLRLEFLVGAFRAIYFDFNYHNAKWRPDGFFESIPFENLEINQRYFKFKAGYRLGW